MIVLVNSFTFNLLRILASVTVSGRPPLLVIITAQPFAEASKLVGGDLPHHPL